jgi:hypothetical protein
MEKIVMEIHVKIVKVVVNYLAIIVVMVICYAKIVMGLAWYHVIRAVVKV